MATNETTRGKEFALKRVQAGRNAEKRVASALFGAVKKIVAASRTYINDGKLTREQDYINEARKLTAETATDIESYLTAYSRVASKTLGVSADVVDDYLEGRIFGKTFTQRNDRYLSYFAEDMVRMVKAGVLLGYSESQILSAIRTGYKEPYKTSVITKAKRFDVNIDVPSYGRGIFKSSYQNIARNVKATIALAWGQAEQEYGRRSGATGFLVFRGSSYPCPTCDDETAYVHRFGDPFPPFHVSCVCYIQFIYENKK